MARWALPKSPSFSYPCLCSRKGSGEADVPHFRGHDTPEAVGFQAWDYAFEKCVASCANNKGIRFPFSWTRWRPRCVPLQAHAASPASFSFQDKGTNAFRGDVDRLCARCRSKYSNIDQLLWFAVRCFRRLPGGVFRSLPGGLLFCPENKPL